VILWENGLGGSGGYERIFWSQMHEFHAKNQKKIRSDLPDPPNPFCHSITKTPNAKFIFQEIRVLKIISLSDFLVNGAPFFRFFRKNKTLLFFFTDFKK
jgi:hypothetical protein